MIGLSKHYHLRLDPKLGHGKCAIKLIPCARIARKTMLDNTWSYNVEPNNHPCYQTVVDYTYWPMLGSFNNWDIIQFTNKTTPIEEFYAVHKVAIYGMSENMASLV